MLILVKRKGHNQISIQLLWLLVSIQTVTITMAIRGYERLLNILPHLNSFLQVIAEKYTHTDNTSLITQVPVSTFKNEIQNTGCMLIKVLSNFQRILSSPAATGVHYSLINTDELFNIRCYSVYLGHLCHTRFNKHEQQISQSKLSGKVLLLNNSDWTVALATHIKNTKCIYKAKRKSSVNN